MFRMFLMPPWCGWAGITESVFPMYKSESTINFAYI